MKKSTIFISDMLLNFSTLPTLVSPQNLKLGQNNYILRQLFWQSFMKIGGNVDFLLMTIFGSVPIFLQQT